MTLVKYLVKLFIPVFLGALLFSALVLNLVDLLMNLWKYIEYKVSVQEVLHLMLLYTPKTFWYAIPLGILFATSYTISALDAQNELVSIFASGVSLLRFTFPLLVFSFVLSIALFFLDDALAVKTFAEKQILQARLLHEDEEKNSENIIILSDGGKIIYKVARYDAAQKTLYNVYVVFRNDKKELLELVYAESATWIEYEKKWKLKNVQSYKTLGGEFVKGSANADLLALLTEEPNTFESNVSSVEEVTVKEAKAYIEHLQKAGLPYQEQLSIFYKKFSFPFIVFIVVFLSIGLSGKTRKNVMLVSLSLSIAAAVLFYVTQMLTMLLAKFSYISAFAGAWFPIFLFIAISIFLLKHTRT